MPINLSEEKEYLEGLEQELHKTADKLLKHMDYYAVNSHESLQYFWEHQWEFDEYEAIFHEFALKRLVDSGESTKEQFRRILTMMDSPYFSRIDFQSPEDPEAMKIYIGKYSFWDAASPYRVFDWRTPVASMYYEFEQGDAWYDAPSGRISGNILCKRQYKIKKGILEYALESGLTITDDLLQQELSHNSDHRMKDIVTTIQKEQNRLIRDESAHTMIIQGVAGSGKTSVALHRAAYYLYRFKNEMTAKNFLIISPNGIFVDYISNVLPELGEETVPSVSMEDVAAPFLPKELKPEPFAVQINRFLESEDRGWAERSAFKATPEFVRRLEEYLDYCNKHYFILQDYVYKNGMVDRDFIDRCLSLQTTLPVKQRLWETAGMIADEIRSRQAKGKYCPPKNEILDWLTCRFRYNDLLELYRNFYVWIGREDLFLRREGMPPESADIFPLVYLQLYLEGGTGNPDIKHLIIDEMQDYTPIQYAVINKLYPCRKTILGDFSQSIMPFVHGSLACMKELYPDARVTEICKSYRSTFEIMEFAGRIRQDVYIEPVHRHGETPAVLACGNAEQERNTVLHLTKEAIEKEPGVRLGILCKSPDQAKLLYLWLKRQLPDSGNLHLLSYDSAEFYGGVMVSSASMSKGLEFDEVIIPEADCKNYRSEYERSLLYVACTRAMHRLTLLYSGEPSPFLPKPASEAAPKK
ncbi:MAG: AAA family ATPase [Butyrivibrio sp.]|nr:AAA family ATPase [Acetatifactor muris]MCM1559736.1 AAA family ATPase [Butyrivibrio sp.]